jgi:AcrR family transcriptional regulator
VRAATIEEIKETATRMLREHGADLRFADIARDMGMTAPALYRYFADRDELLSALMVDGFQEMSDTLTAALDTAAPDDLAGRIRAAAIAYRDFAKADPSRFSLLFGLPNPGFGRHSEHSSGPAAGATMASLERLVQSVVEQGKLPTPLVRDVGERGGHNRATERRPAHTGRRLPSARALPRRSPRLRVPRELRPPQLDHRAIARRALRSTDRAADPCDGR